MTYFEKAVLTLLVMIWEAVHQAPGVATYEKDRKYIEKIEKRIGMN